MKLATPDDMRAAFEADEITDLVFRHEHDVLGDAERRAAENAILADAAGKASAEAASYLAARYPAFDALELPPGFVVPPAVTVAVCDIARYRMTGSGATETDVIAQRYKNALRWLQDIAGGKAILPGMAQGGTPDGTVYFSPGRRLFCKTATGENA